MKRPDIVKSTKEDRPKMMPPNSQSVAQIGREAGVCEPTLYTWKKHYQREGIAVPADPSNPENWSGEDKLTVVI